jgi:hypothetical protein
MGPVRFVPRIRYLEQLCPRPPAGDDRTAGAILRAIRPAENHQRRNAPLGQSLQHQGVGHVGDGRGLGRQPQRAGQPVHGRVPRRPGARIAEARPGADQDDPAHGRIRRQHASQAQIAPEGVAQEHRRPRAARDAQPQFSGNGVDVVRSGRIGATCPVTRQIPDLRLDRGAYKATQRGQQKGPDGS